MTSRNRAATERGSKGLKSMRLMTVASAICIIVAAISWRRAFASRLVSATVGVLTLVSLMMIGTYFIVDALTGNGVDESVMFHLRTGLKGAGLWDFGDLIAISSVLVLAAIFTSVLVAWISLGEGKVRKVRPWRRMIGFLALVLSLVVNPLFLDTARYLSRAGASDSKLPGLYMQARPIAASARGRNFVILYLEQFERTYFDQTLFPELTPNLSELQDQALSFTNIGEVPGTEWTMGGMTASQCGVPLVAPYGNMMARIDRFLPDATCIGDLMSANGYRLEYLGGADLDFAGKGLFYRDHGFARVEGLEDLEPLLDDPGYTSWWGIYDDTLFDVAKQRFNELAAGADPFGLVLLTLDTHQPDGHLSAACGEQLFGDGENPILNAVHCADRMASDFIAYVRASPAFTDTVLVVASDHLAMPNTASNMLDTRERRNLLMFFGQSLEARQMDRAGSTLDIAPTLLSLVGMNVEGLGFGRDLLKDGPTISEMDRSPEEILWTHWRFFNSLWSFPQLDHGIRLDLAAKRLLLGDRYEDLPVLLVVNSDHSVEEVRFEAYTPQMLPEQLVQLPFGQFFVWVDACGRLGQLGIARPPTASRYCATFGTLGDPDLSFVALADGEGVDAAVLRAAQDGAVPDRVVHDVRVSNFARARWSGENDVTMYEPSSVLTGHFGLVSSGLAAASSRVTNLDLGNSVDLPPGLTLLGLDVDQPPFELAHVDVCAPGQVPADRAEPDGRFQAVMARATDRFGAFAIVAHGAAACDDAKQDLERLFDGSPFSRWREMQAYQPYVAILDGDGRAAEYLGQPGQSLAVEALTFARAVAP